jgi:hypothetical protein
MHYSTLKKQNINKSLFRFNITSNDISEYITKYYPNTDINISIDEKTLTKLNEDFLQEIFQNATKFPNVFEFLDNIEKVYSSSNVVVELSKKYIEENINIKTPYELFETVCDIIMKDLIGGIIETIIEYESINASNIDEIKEQLLRKDEINYFYNYFYNM